MKSVINIPSNDFSEVGEECKCLHGRYVSRAVSLKMSKSSNIYDLINNNNNNNNNGEKKQNKFPYEIKKIDSNLNAQLLQDFTGTFLDFFNTNQY